MKKPKNEAKADEEAASSSDHSYHRSVTTAGRKTKAQQVNKTINDYKMVLDRMCTVKGSPEKVIDLVKGDNEDVVKCLVKYSGNDTTEWVLADDIRRTHPLLLIDYYETRIILRKNQCEMAFDCSATASSRKLVMIKSK